LAVHEVAVDAQTLKRAFGSVNVGPRWFLGPDASRFEVREWWDWAGAARVRLDPEAMMVCVDRAGAGRWECAQMDVNRISALISSLHAPEEPEATKVGRGEGETPRPNGNAPARIYKSTAVKRYGLTSYQIELAVESGLLTRAKRIKNPHYRSAPEALLLEEAELVEKLEAVRALPRRSEAELERAREYARRSKIVAGAAFHCPICGRTIRPLRDSITRSALLGGGLTPEEARTVAVVTHFRHLHTAYDDVRRDQGLVMHRYLSLEEGTRAVRIRELLERGHLRLRMLLDMEEELGALLNVAFERMKRAYTEEAIARAREEGLLPQDFTIERYEAIAGPLRP